MRTDRPVAPEQHLRALASGDAAVLETLARMRLGTLERSRLSKETYLLARLAALVATDAAPVSYLAHLGPPDHLGISMADVMSTFVAIAPVVGSARVLSAASNLAQAGFIATDPDRPATEQG
jgi:4-carboxymuconolactone decarboxylase